MAATVSWPPESRKTILILGASYAGMSTAHYLLKHVIPKLATPSAYEVILASPSEHTMDRPACPRALIADHFFNQNKLFVRIEEQYRQYPEGSFRFVHGAAVGFDQGRRVVTVTQNGGTQEITFHALVIATGASTPSPLFGFNSGDRESLRAHWEAFRKALPKAKSILIAGGGPAGVETAGELGEHLNGSAGWFASKNTDPKVPITLITAGDRLLPALRPSIGKKAEAKLAKLGVTVMTSTRVAAVSPVTAGENMDNLTAKTNITLGSGGTLEADLYIPATGVRPNTSFLPDEMLAAGGRVSADPQTFRITNTTDPNPLIYSIGDCSSAFKAPSCHITFAAVPFLGSTIQRDLLRAEGSPAAGEDRLFVEDTREMQLVPIGKSDGVGVGFGWTFPGWAVWLVKGRDYWLWTTPNLWNGKQFAKAS